MRLSSRELRLRQLQRLAALDMTVGHTTAVEDVSRLERNAGTEHQGVCTCAWRSPVTRSYRAAQLAIANHHGDLAAVLAADELTPDWRSRLALAGRRP